MRRALPALVLLLAGCGSTPGTIAFTSTRDGNAEVYVMRADGSHVVDLTRNLAQDGQPAWSPDGTKIAFVSTRDGNAHIYVMNPDGSRQRQLTRSDDNDTAPVWSPDGRKIAFMCTTATPRLVTEICVVNADGTGARELTSPAEGDNLYPVWLPGSKSIFFTRPHGVGGVYVGDGGRQRFQFPGDVAEFAPAPKGDTFVYLKRAGPKAAWALYVGRQRVWSGPGSADSPVWSPDGGRIAFTSIGSRSDLRVVNADGTGQRQLTSGPGNSLSPRWSPDGKSIAFERLRGQSSEVYVVRADGTGEKRLTRGAGKNGGPAWRP
jgi:Tol biopolymer transport system component